MSGMQVALIRGINVGTAKRVAMADLRAMLEQLGYSGVRTILNSGNAVFSSPANTPMQTAARIEQALAAQLRISARVIVLSAAEVAVAVAGNSLRDLATNPSRLLVTVLGNRADRARLAPLLRERWAPEALALGARVSYQWCPGGILASPVAKAVNKVLGEHSTARNWSTFLKLHELARTPG